MRYPTKHFWLCAIPILMAPAMVLASNIEINGVCQQAAPDCLPAGLQASALHVGGSTGPDSLDVSNYTINTDTYDINITSYGATYLSGTYIYIDLSATYTGSSPSTSADTIQVDELQDFFDNTPGTWDGNYTEVVPVIVGNGATFQANLCYNGGLSTQCVGQVGPVGAGTYNSSLSSNLVGLGGGDYLAADFQFVFNFSDGTLPGTTVDVRSSVPEPSQRIAVALALLGGLCGMLIRRRKLSLRKEA
jgi:hypothetical protein